MICIASQFYFLGNDSFNFFWGFTSYVQILDKIFLGFCETALLN